MVDLNELSREIEKEENTLINGGVFKKSLFQKIIDKVNHAAITLTLLGALAGISIPKYANAQERNIITVSVSNDTVAIVKKDLMLANKFIEEHNYNEANKKIKELYNISSAIKDNELSILTKKLMIKLVEKQRSNSGQLQEHHTLTISETKTSNKLINGEIHKIINLRYKVITNIKQGEIKKNMDRLYSCKKELIDRIEKDTNQKINLSDIHEENSYGFVELHVVKDMVL